MAISQVDTKCLMHAFGRLSLPTVYQTLPDAAHGIYGYADDADGATAGSKAQTRLAYARTLSDRGCGQLRDPAQERSRSPIYG